MDRIRFERYLSSFPPRSSTGSAASFSADRALSAAFLPAGRGGVEKSWLESSVSSSSPGQARLIHYYTVSEALKPAERKKLWVSACGRFLDLLEECGRPGHRFNLDKAAGLRDALARSLSHYSPVIVSAEWVPGSACGKATLYAVTEAPLGPAAARLARLEGNAKAWMGPVSDEHMGFLGVDFYPGGRVECKVYRRYTPGAAGLAGRPAVLAARLGAAFGLLSVHQVYKFDRKTSRVYLDKVHLKPRKKISKDFLAGRGGLADAGTAKLLEARAGAGARVTYAGFKPDGSGLELYFR